MSPGVNGLALLDGFSKMRVLVVGDLMIDHYIWGGEPELSPEAPVPLVSWKRESRGPGGAANVAANLVALGAQVTLAGVVGDDLNGEELIALARAVGMDVSSIAVSSERPTTCKTRVFAGGRQVVRLDRESRRALAEREGEELLDSCLAQVPKVDLVILSDYSKGVFPGAVAQAMIGECRNRGILVTAGPKPQNLSHFQGAHLASLNRAEATEAWGQELASRDQIEKAGRALLHAHAFQFLAITEGACGVSWFARGGPACHLSAHRIEVFDPCGCGDTLLATASLALAADGARQPETAFYLGNLAAAGVAQKVGVATVDLAELRALAAGNDRLAGAPAAGAHHPIGPECQDGR